MLGLRALRTPIRGGVAKEEGARPTPDQGFRQPGPVREPPVRPPHPMSARIGDTLVGWRDTFLPDTSPCRATGSCGTAYAGCISICRLGRRPEGAWRTAFRAFLAEETCGSRLPASGVAAPAQSGGGPRMMPGSSDEPDPQPGILRWCPALGWCQRPAIPIATPQLILGRRCRNSCVRMPTRRTALQVGSNTPIRRHSLLEVAGRTLTNVQDRCQPPANGRRVIGARARISQQPIDDGGHDPSKRARKHPSCRLEQLGVRKRRGAPACELQPHPVRLGGAPENPGAAPELVHCRAVARGSAGSFPVAQLRDQVRGGSCSGGCPGTHICVARHGAFRQGHGLRGRIRRAQAPYRWDESRRVALRAKLDAVFFHLYGITDRNDVEYVYSSSFSAVESQESQAFGSFRSHDLCLSYIDALAAGQPDASIQ